MKTTLLTWDQVRDAPEPIDGAEVRWFTIMGYGADIVEKRATFHMDCRWEDHPWGRSKGAVGAPFVHTWAIWEKSRSSDRFHASGRTNRGWGELNLSKKAEPGEYQCFETREEAEARAREILTNRLDRHRGEIKMIEERLEELG